MTRKVTRILKAMILLSKFKQILAKHFIEYSYPPLPEIWSDSSELGIIFVELFIFSFVTVGWCITGTWYLIRILYGYQMIKLVMMEIDNFGEKKTVCHQIPYKLNTRRAIYILVELLCNKLTSNILLLPRQNMKKEDLKFVTIFYLFDL